MTAKSFSKDFFGKWSPDTAYVLGFFTADGSMYRTRRGGYFIEFQITDRDLLESIKYALDSTHKISVLERGRKTLYRLQVGSKQVFLDLLRIGLTPNKSKTVGLPTIPNKLFRHFLRGYFDGDGSIAHGFFKRRNRKTLNHIFYLRFTSGSKSILVDIKSKLSAILAAEGYLGRYSGAWRLNYSKISAQKICEFMYARCSPEGLIFLERKYKIFQEHKAHAAVA